MVYRIAVAIWAVVCPDEALTEEVRQYLLDLATDLWFKADWLDYRQLTEAFATACDKFEGVVY